MTSSACSLEALLVCLSSTIIESCHFYLCVFISPFQTLVQALVFSCINYSKDCPSLLCLIHTVHRQLSYLSLWFPAFSEAHSHWPYVSLTHDLCFQNISTSSSHFSSPDFHGEGLAPLSLLVHLIFVLSVQQLWSWPSFSNLDCFCQTIYQQFLNWTFFG